MSSNPSSNATATESDLQSIKKGIPDVVPAGKTFFFKGVNYDQQGFTQLVQGNLDAYENVQKLRAQLDQAIKERDSKDDAARQFVNEIEAASIANYGESSSEFNSLGFKSKKKPAPLSPEKKQLKYKRFLATRKARNVMGKRQRQAVKGVVDPGTDSAPPASGAGGAGGNVTK